MSRRVAGGQGAYYVLTGLWPLLHLESFLAAAGPKTDVWLLQTLALVMCVIGGALLVASMQQTVSVPMGVLGCGCALAVASIEFYYAIRGEIWPIYLLDAILEILMAVLWTFALFQRRKPVRATTPAPAPGAAPMGTRAPIK